MPPAPPDATSPADPAREMLRHTLATLAYRGGKAVRNAPPGFGDRRPAPGSRSAGEILAHVGDLLDWAVALADGRHEWHDSPPRPWPEEVERFFAGLAALERRLAGPDPLGSPPERLFQGPIADALTHVGQISMLRRMSGAPVRGENYFKADIVAGRVGPEQTTPRREFD
jgi:hypothetical protein